jgi:ABC-type multidrug transport system ATPase subunit
MLANTIRKLKAEGLTVLLSVQNLHFATTIADRALIIEKGRIRCSGEMSALAADTELQRAQSRTSRIRGSACASPWNIRGTVLWTRSTYR